jgi:NAD(P)H-dependent flavin oxidoreductase YrpB (nitropropane dioxygenase family)
MKKQGILWFANISTVSEAKAAEAAGADVIVAQGSEAGGHRGSFSAQDAIARQVGLFSLLPAVVDAVKLPVVATGGIADARGVAAALMLGASAAQIGTGFLRCPEAKIHPAWADALGRAAPEDTMVSRVFSGRAGRSLATEYARAATAKSAPEPAPTPFSAVSLLSCESRPARPVTSIACRHGRGSLRDWQKLFPRPKFSMARGAEHVPFSKVERAGERWTPASDGVLMPSVFQQF